MYWVLIVLHVIVCAFLVLVVLLQAGKGGGMGIAFGGGGSQTVFGSSGAGNFLTKMTAICATIFFLNSLALAYLSSQSDSSRLQRLAEQKAADQEGRGGGQGQGGQGHREGPRGAAEEGRRPARRGPRASSTPGGHDAPAPRQATAGAGDHATRQRPPADRAAEPPAPAKTP